MERVSVHLPDEFAAKAHAAGLDLSGLVQDAIWSELDACSLDRWLDEAAAAAPTVVDVETIVEAVRAVRDELEFGA
ncbi:antitoxin [Candidatus Poriferisodalis sp.]|uniref:antitoxin n=1 Tax=Candidatus Poriferisodalis sp. TaxID=3101277 RepID=UPI003B0108F3